MQLVSNIKVNLPQPLPPQLICNQGNHSVAKTTNQFLQWSIRDYPFMLIKKECSDCSGRLMKYQLWQNLHCTSKLPWKLL